MLIGLVIAAVVALVALVAAVRREREMRNMAEFLRERPASSNARISVELRSSGALDLAQTINNKLDEIQYERIADAAREQELQRTLSALSHDIRTPLAAAQGYLQLLEVENQDETREHYADVMSKRLTDVRQLLDELLLYAKTQDDAWTPAVQLVDVGELLAEVLASFYPQFAKKGWTPHVELPQEPYIISTDAEALSRIFRNLTANTLRHGIDAPRIVQREGCITFANRIANPESMDTSRLFERFYRGDSARTEGGTGLGLAIVAELAAALGATVKATSASSALSITLNLPASH